MDCWWQKAFSKNPVIADCRYLIWYTETPTKWLENGTFFHCWRSVLVSLLCRMIITEGDGRHLFKTGRYWRRKPDQRFWKPNKTYCLQPQPNETGVRRSERDIYWGLTLTKPVDLATHGLYEHYCNGKTVKEGVLTLCRRDKGAMLPFIIYTLTNVQISRMSNHGDAEGSATETVDLVYSHIRWDIPALASKSKTRRPLHRQALWRWG